MGNYKNEIFDTGQPQMIIVLAMFLSVVLAEKSFLLSLILASGAMYLLIEYALHLSLNYKLKFTFLSRIFSAKTFTKTIEIPISPRKNFADEITDDQELAQIMSTVNPLSWGIENMDPEIQKKVILVRKEAQILTDQFIEDIEHINTWGDLLSQIDLMKKRALLSFELFHPKKLP